MLKRLVSVGSIALLAAIGLAGCGDDKEKADDPAVVATTEAPAQATKLAVSASEPSAGKYAFAGIPATVTGGLVEITLTNSGKEDHEVQLVGLDAPHTADEVKTLFANEKDGDPTPPWLHGSGGTSSVKAGGTTTASVILKDGTYAFMCFIDDEKEVGHYQNGMLGSFTVSGSKAGAVLPSTSAKVTVKEPSKTAYTFETSGLKAGSNTITFENAGSEIHHALMFPIAAGKTIDDVKTAFASDGPPQGPPPVDFESGTGTSVIDGGTSLVTTVDLKAGDYAFVCFISDRAGGPPHLAKGLLTKVTVT